MILGSLLSAQQAEPARQLAEMAALDSHQRISLAYLIQEVGPTHPRVEAQLAEIHRTDSLHGHKLATIMLETGFRPLLRHDPETAHALWQLVMQQDRRPRMQYGLMRDMESLRRSGHVILKDMAYLTDRIAVNSGEPQLYGTQTYLDKEKDRYLPYPIIEEGLKERRSEMMLPSLKKQLKEENKQHKVKF